MPHWGERLQRLRLAADRFLATPAAPLPLGILRIGLGLLLLTQALALAPHLSALYGSQGLVQAPVVDVLLRRWTPRVAWLTGVLAPLGLGEAAAIRTVFVLHLCGSLAFLVGWHTRLAAVGVWLTNLTLTATAAPHTYGVDTFVKIALFYCLLAPVGAALSWDAATGRVSTAPSSAARLSLRVLQAHLSLVYLASGIEKASGAQWWNGEALWRSWMRDDLGTLDFSWVAWCPWLAMVGCWTTLWIEVGYAFGAWPRRTRRAWAWATIALHAGIGLTLGLWGFAWIMMLLTACAWLVPGEPALRDAATALEVQRLLLNAER